MPITSRPRVRSLRPDGSLRHPAMAMLITLTLAGCSDDPPPIPAERLDPVAVAAAATVTVAEYSAEVEQVVDARRLDPQRATYHAFRDRIERAGLIRIADSGGLEMTDAGIASAWRVRPGMASWVVGPARIDRILGYVLVETANLDSQVCCGVPYQASVDTVALGQHDAPLVVQGLARNLWNDGRDVQPWFDPAGKLMVSAEVWTTALTDAFREQADGPPVDGIRQWQDADSARCPNADAIGILRNALRRSLFAIVQTVVKEPRSAQPLDADTTTRFVAGEFDAGFDQDPRFLQLDPAATSARALSLAFDECAQSSGADPRTAAWAELWAHDTALLWGDANLSAPVSLFDGERTPLRLAQVRKLAELEDKLAANGRQRLLAVQALQQSAYPDVARYARWVANERKQIRAFSPPSAR